MSNRELTPPFDGAVDLPVRVGWYPVKSKCAEYPPDEGLRSYWDGSRFSRFVLDYEDDDEADYCKAKPSNFKNEEILWCGLTAPYSK